MNPFDFQDADMSGLVRLLGGDDELTGEKTSVSKFDDVTRDVTLIETSGYCDEDTGLGESIHLVFALEIRNTSKW